MSGQRDPRRVVDVAGVGVLLSAEPGGEGMVEAAGEALAPWEAEPAISVRVQRPAPPLPARSPDASGDGVAAWWEGDGVTVALRGSVARAHRDTAIIGGPDVGDSLRPLLTLVLMHLLAAHGRFVIHAAAVVDDGARLVLGNSGAGKSTVAAAALASGWRVLCDDLAVLRAGDDGPEVAGFPRALAIPAEALGPLAGEAVPIAGDPRGRHALAPSTLTAGWFPVHGTVLVAQDVDGDGAVTRVRGDVVLRRLLASSFLVGDPPLLRAFHPLAGAVARLPAAELRTAADPETRHANAAQLLASVQQMR